MDFPFELSSSTVFFPDYAPETVHTNSITVRNKSSQSQVLVVYAPPSKVFSVHVHAPDSHAGVATVAAADPPAASKLGRSVTLAPGITVRLTVKLCAVPSPAAAVSAASAKQPGAGKASASVAAMLSTLDTPPLAPLADEFLLAVGGALDGSSDAAVRDAITAAAAALANGSLRCAALAAARGPVRAVSLRAAPPASRIVFAPGQGVIVPAATGGAAGAAAAGAVAAADPVFSRLLPHGVVCDLGAVLARHKGVLRVRLENLGARAGRWELAAEPFPADGGAAAAGPATPAGGAPVTARGAAAAPGTDIASFIAISPPGGVLAPGARAGAARRRGAPRGASGLGTGLSDDDSDDGGLSHSGSRDGLLQSSAFVTLTFSPPVDLTPGPCRALLRLVQTDDETEVAGGPLASASLAEKMRRVRAEATADASAVAGVPDVLACVAASFVSQSLQLFRPSAPAVTGAGAAAGGAAEAALGAPLASLDFGAVLYGQQRALKTLLHNPTSLPAHFSIQMDRASVQRDDNTVSATGAVVVAHAPDGAPTPSNTAGPGAGKDAGAKSASIGGASGKSASAAAAISQIVAVPFEGNIPPFSSREVTFTFVPAAPIGVPARAGAATATSSSADPARPARVSVSTEVSATAVISSLDAAARLRVPMRAVGLEPTLALTPDHVDFGACPVYERRDVRATLTNPSPHRALPFHFGSVAQFAVHPRTGTLAPLETRTVTLSFTPHNLGRHAGELPLDIAAGARTVFVPLAGRADGYSATETAASASARDAAAVAASAAGDRSQPPSRTAPLDGTFGAFAALTERGAPGSPSRTFAGTMPRRPVQTGVGKSPSDAPGPRAPAPLVPGHFVEAPSSEPLSRSSVVLSREMKRAARLMRRADAWTPNDNDAAAAAAARAGEDSDGGDDAPPVDRTSIGGIGDGDDDDDAKTPSDSRAGADCNDEEDDDSTPEGRARARERREQLRRLQGLEPESTTHLVWVNETGGAVPAGAAMALGATASLGAGGKTGKHFRTGWCNPTLMAELQRAREANGDDAWEARYTYDFAEARAKVEHRRFYDGYLTQSRKLRAAATGTDAGARSPRSAPTAAAAAAVAAGDEDPSLGMVFAEGLHMPQPQLPRADPSLVLSYDPRALYTQTVQQVLAARRSSAARDAGVSGSAALPPGLASQLAATARFAGPSSHSAAAATSAAVLLPLLKLTPSTQAERKDCSALLSNEQLARIVRATHAATAAAVAAVASASSASGLAPTPASGTRSSAVHAAHLAATAAGAASLAFPPQCVGAAGRQPLVVHNPLESHIFVELLLGGGAHDAAAQPSPARGGFRDGSSGDSRAGSAFGTPSASSTSLLSPLGPAHGPHASSSALLLGGSASTGALASSASSASLSGGAAAAAGASSAASVPELAHSFPRSQMLAPGQTAVFNVVLQLRDAQEYQRTVQYRVNTHHVFGVALVADIVPMSLNVVLPAASLTANGSAAAAAATAAAAAASKPAAGAEASSSALVPAGGIVPAQPHTSPQHNAHSTIHFAFAPNNSSFSVTEKVFLQNPHARPVSWWLTSHSNAFSASFTSGTVEPGESVPVEITYAPASAHRPVEHEFTLHVREGPPRTLLCRAYLEEARVELRTVSSAATKGKYLSPAEYARVQELNRAGLLHFGAIPAGAPTARTFTVANSGATRSVFAVATDALPAGVAIEPAWALLQPHSSLTVTVTLTPPVAPDAGAIECAGDGDAPDIGRFGSVLRGLEYATPEGAFGRTFAAAGVHDSPTESPETAYRGVAASAGASLQSNNKNEEVLAAAVAAADGSAARPALDIVAPFRAVIPVRVRGRAASARPLRLTIEATIVQPQIAVAEAEFAFGTVGVAGQSEQLPLTLHNASALPVVCALALGEEQYDLFSFAPATSSPAPQQQQQGSPMTGGLSDPSAAAGAPVLVPLPHLLAQYAEQLASASADVVPEAALTTGADRPGSRGKPAAGRADAVVAGATTAAAGKAGKALMATTGGKMAAAGATAQQQARTLSLSVLPPAAAAAAGVPPGAVVAPVFWDDLPAHFKVLIPRPHSAAACSADASASVRGPRAPRAGPGGLSRIASGRASALSSAPASGAGSPVSRPDTADGSPLPLPSLTASSSFAPSPVAGVSSPSRAGSRAGSSPSRRRAAGVSRALQRHARVWLVLVPPRRSFTPGALTFTPTQHGLTLQLPLPVLAPGLAAGAYPPLQRVVSAVTIPPTVTLSQDTVDFGTRIIVDPSALPGAAYTHTVTVTNTSTGPLRWLIATPANALPFPVAGAAASAAPEVDYDSATTPARPIGSAPGGAHPRTDAAMAAAVAVVNSGASPASAAAALLQSFAPLPPVSTGLAPFVSFTPASGTLAAGEACRVTVRAAPSQVGVFSLDASVFVTPLPDAALAPEAAPASPGRLRSHGYDFPPHLVDRELLGARDDDTTAAAAGATAHVSGHSHGDSLFDSSRVGAAAPGALSAYAGGYYAEPYTRLRLRGHAVRPSLQFGVPEVVMPVVPLGATSSAVFTVSTKGYASFELSPRLPAETRVPLTVTFPAGRTLTAEYPSVSVVVSFTSPVPAAFTTRLEFLDPDGVPFGILVHGHCDNSVLSLYPYLHRHAPNWVLTLPTAARPPYLVSRPPPPVLAGSTGAPTALAPAPGGKPAHGHGHKTVHILADPVGPGAGPGAASGGSSKSHRGGPAELFAADRSEELQLGLAAMIAYF
jgi:hypothetical protein